MNAPAVHVFRRVRSDALPENINYSDTGCSVAAACLSCPLEQCRYDTPGGLRGIQAQRLTQDIQMLREDRLPVWLVAEMVGSSRRTVFRLLTVKRAVTA